MFDDWFNQLIGISGDSISPSSQVGGDLSWLDELTGGNGFNAGGWGTDESLPISPDDAVSSQSWLSQLFNGAPNGTASTLQKLLLGSTAGGGANGLLSSLGGGSNGLLGTLASVAPSLAAIAYARNQNPFDTSRLQSLYSQYNPEAQASQYDVNTGLGRTKLTSDLARRGVSGSSFGDQSLTNFNTARDLGRASLINQGVGTQAGIAGQILGADVSSQQMKNDLYGRALLALSGGLAPRTSGGLLAGGLAP
jgi:hypothetical protein